QKTNTFLLDKRVKENNDRLGEIQARLQSLEIGLGEIKGTLEEMKASSGKAPSGAAPSAAAPTAPLPGTGPAEVATSAAEPPAIAAPAKPSAEMISPPPPGPLGSQELYNQAMKLLKGGEPGQAILEFEKYVREYPRSELADNAQYWIGEAYYVQREFPRALMEFQKVLTHFPQADKAPDALYKVALSYLEMGQKEKAKAELRRLISQYPDSAPASLARKKMAELSK
ncbi:MAG: tol-pal system protein YbgF, partial [candidate division NC10 bacterium]|nr:tol-pal system protein YbgF [candidate division NC10 bacterium]